ncbi:DNA polymerase zeta [Steccherinum ochraceum]|uniref:DNA polymerase n=1 Tax=Steccherinum ochraceum TaxID=92696 RepID=A0A4R0RWB6_9APHY|nr:DNA polymerase zeta [Steccherinum ochraceum]
MPVEQSQDKLVLKHPKGPSVEILLYGATVTSWKSGSKTSPEPIERLFVSSKAALDGSKPVRGGIPVVFPCFGAPTHPEHSKLSQHGFARSSIWKFGGIVMDNEAGVSVRLTLEPTPEIQAIYDKPFELAYVVTLAEHQISTDLHVKNVGLSTTGPLEFQALFHNYIRGPSSDILISPLQGVSYYDKTEASEELKTKAKVEGRAGVDVKKFTDFVYENAPGAYEIKWPGGAIAIKTVNFPNVVVWNPQETGAKIGDMEPGGWEKYVCVEPGHVRGFVQLEAGKSWVGQQVITVEQINQIDHALISPGPLDDVGIRRAPVIRIYGKSSNGKKACLFVHKVYPYFFIEYLGKTNAKSVNRYITKFTHSLNHAIAVSLKRNPHSPNSQFVRAAILVKGVHFYGFHSKYSPFLKVHLVDPAFMNRAATILQSGSIMKTRFRVYENHLSFVLQFLCDFGLYGCGWIDLSSNIWKRGEDGDEEDHGELLPFKLSPYHRQSRMPIELDVEAHDILNRHRLTARNLHHKLSIPATPQPPEPLVISVRELWDDERRRRVSRGLPPSPEVPKDLSEGSRGEGGAWVAEARWWEEIEKRITREREVSSEQGADEEDEEWAKWVMTTFESVEALWNSQHRTWRPGGKKARPDDVFDSNPYEHTSQAPRAPQPRQGSVEPDVDVDESLLSSQELSFLIEQEEVDAVQQQKERDEDIDNIRDAEVAEDALPEDSTADDADTTPKADRPGPSQTVNEHDQENPFADVWDNLRNSRSPSRPPAADSAYNITPTQQAEAVQSGHDDTPHAPPIVDHSPENPFLVTDEETTVTNSFPVPVASASNANIGRISSQLHQLSDGDGSDQLIERPHKKIKLMVEEVIKLPTYPSLLLRSSAAQQGTLFSSFATGYRVASNSFRYNHMPPTSAELLSSMATYNLPNKIYQDPYYSLESDASDHPWEFAGLSYHIKGGTGVGALDEWVQTSSVVPGEASLSKGIGHSTRLWGWEYASSPPDIKEVRRWWTDKGQHLQSVDEKTKKSSQIEGPTQKNPYGFQTTPGAPLTTSFREKGNMEVLGLEIFAPSHDGKQSNPGKDEIVALFWCLHDPNVTSLDEDFRQRCESGTIVVRNASLSQQRLRGWELDVVDSELDLLNRAIDIVNEHDPDIIIGWEVQAMSWGYLDARARTYGLDLGEQISRAPGRVDTGNNQWGERTSSTFRVIGRHVLNVWRIIRAEQDYTSHTFEHAVFQLLHKRTPRYSSTSLTAWYRSDVPDRTSHLLRYLSDRLVMLVELVDVAEIVTKNAEFARVFGVDFFSVLSRGSQFKVESFMFRIAKPESFVLLSPSRQDVGKQNAAECMPLIMEPLSAFYSSPLVVLDFQSLYPSVMIAYNYCYSTCVGRTTDFKGQNKFGVTELHQPPGLLETLHDHVNVAPNGIIYVKPEVRKGLLGRMLTELLDTRVMVKQAMKSVGDDKALRRVLDARQLGLKFIANVTYGYTSATYSGRMPAVEIADSIVQSGRETLEKAIQLIDGNEKWGARVVYGDTDSLFIYLRGKTKDQAFRIGHDIADTVTAMNPAPIKLKFEKVYLPCVLMAKKRYVGWKYETPDEREAGFDAKGIETVRRDGVPAQRKMVETCLKILFRTQDLSKVKEYCYNSWTRILEDKASLQDFIFAKEVKMGTYSEKGPPPPGVVVAARRVIEDPNDEAHYGERIPYVIVRGNPLDRLVDKAVAPDVVLNDGQLHIDAAYYIGRVLIPPLERIFNLMGADVRGWYDEMPKSSRMDEADTVTLSPRKEAILLNRLKIDEHFLNSLCLIPLDRIVQAVSQTSAIDHLKPSVSRT